MTVMAPARKKSVTIPENLLAEAQERSGSRGLSAYVTRALATQLEIDRLSDYVTAVEAENGPVPQHIQDQFYADLAAADAKIGYLR